jgi:hypothetical protein
VQTADDEGMANAQSPETLPVGSGYRPALSQHQRLQYRNGSPVAVKICKPPGQPKS